MHILEAERLRKSKVVKRKYDHSSQKGQAHDKLQAL